VGEDDAGLLVPPEDPVALANAIKRLLADKALRQKMGLMARKRIEQRFSWEDAARRTLKIYEEVV